LFVGLSIGRLGGGRLWRWRRATLRGRAGLLPRLLRPAFTRPVLGDARRRRQRAVAVSGRRFITVRLHALAAVNGVWRGGSGRPQVRVERRWVWHRGVRRRSGRKQLKERLQLSAGSGG
jgi:hypothetical protein